MTLPKIKKTNPGNNSKAAARILRALLCFAFWIGIWYIAAAALGKAVILPMPHDVAKRLITLAGTKDFVLTCLRSLGSVFAGILFFFFFCGENDSLLVGKALIGVRTKHQHFLAVHQHFRILM